MAGPAGGPDRSHSKAEHAALDRLASMTDPAGIRQLRRNALQMGSEVVAEAAFRRLVDILPDETPGTVEHDFWRTIHAFEESLTQERERTTRLSRTRQKLGRVGIIKTLEDFATSKAPAEGFSMLIERNLPELTGEAVILRHSDRFEDRIVEAARARLVEAGVDVAALPRT